MRSFWRGVGRVIFWSYDRGSWPYDALVIAILIFVLATPRSWFHDGPALGGAEPAAVQLGAQDDDGGTQTYRVDAMALSPEKRTTRSTPELERETHDILGRTVADLKDRTFQVVRIDPAIGSDGSVQHYDVTVR